LWRRIGGKQVRAVGTVGGNIANGSPIGDTPPVLIALDAMIELRLGAELRTLYLDDFFIDYGKQDRAPGEFITGILLPKPSSDHVFRCYKISKRFDQDISSVLGAFRFTVRDNKVTQARIAYGGMAAIPKRANHAEAAVEGIDLAMPATWSAALNAVVEDYSPIGDHRASALYRIETARSLLGKALVEAGGTVSSQTRITGIREEADAAAL
jgi:xanthine dehydrogenase small subunit